MNAIALDTANPTHLFAGTDVGVFRSLDDSVNWSLWREALPNVAVNDLRLHTLARLLRAATHGLGIWERELDATTSTDAVICMRDNVMHTSRGTAPSGPASMIEDPTQHIALNDWVYWWQCADAPLPRPVRPWARSRLDPTVVQDDHFPRSCSDRRVFRWQCNIRLNHISKVLLAKATLCLRSGP